MNSSGALADPLGTTTETVTDSPTGPAGEVQVIKDPETTETSVAGLDPNRTSVASGSKPTPVIVTTVPPAAGPDVGEMERITGKEAS